MRAGSGEAAVRGSAGRHLLAPVRLLVRRPTRAPSLAGHLLAALLLAHLAFLAVASAATGVVHPYTSELEVELALAVHAMATPALTALFLALTYLGSWAGNALLVTSAAWLLARWRSPILGAMLVAVMLGAWWIETITKLIVHRARPELFRLSWAGGYSFPSGHALMATCLYVSIALTFGRRARKPWQRGALAVLAVVMPLGIGLSRVYLGVHFPTDVLGGWLAGLTWLVASWTGFRIWVSKRRPSRGADPK